VPPAEALAPRSRRRVPAAALSLLLLSGTVIASLALALSHEAASAPQGGTRHGTLALARDVLTGRLPGPDGRPAAPESGPGSADRPLELRFVPSSDSSQSGPAIANLLTFLRQRTGYAVKGEVLRSYGLVIQELIEGRCDVAFLTAASYARAYRATQGGEPDDDIVVFLSAVRQGSAEHPGSDLAYRGAILVRKDSPLERIEDLGAGRTIALGGRTSGAGSILPSELLNSLALAPRIQRFEGYGPILTAVAQGAVDAGAIWWSPPNKDNPQNDARITVRELIPDIFEITRILAYTAWIPNEPVVARKALPAQVLHVLARSLSLYVVGKAVSEEGRRELESIGSVVGLIPANDDDFAPLHEVVERAFAQDPEGRADFMAGSR